MSSESPEVRKSESREVRGLNLLLAFLLAVSMTTAPAARQEWRATALASFDDVWQTIHDTFYDPTFGGLNWDAVRTELRPKVEAAASPEAARDVIREMLARLKRSHFVLLSAESATDTLPGEAVVPIDVRMGALGLVITRVRPASAAERAGLHAGDVVLEIDGQTIASWLQSAQGGDDRARYLEVWRRAYRALHGDAGSNAALRVRAPDGRERSIIVTRGAEPGDVVKLGNLPPLHVTMDAREVTSPGGRRVGVIAFNIWMATLNDPIAAAVDKYRNDAALVIDLRGNPGGLAGMITGVAGHLLAEPKVLGTMQTRAQQLHFAANPRRSTPDGRSVMPFAGPVAILVDEISASASECFAGGLQSLGRARIFGRQTMGQALPASTKTLVNGDVLMYALGDFVTSTGKRLEGDGVIPDVSQPLSVAALAAGRDLTLDAALSWIDTRSGGSD